MNPVYNFKGQVALVRRHEVIIVSLAAPRWEPAKVQFRRPRAIPRSSFRSVVGKADPAVVEEAGEVDPALELEHVIDRLENLGRARQGIAGAQQPGVHVVEKPFTWTADPDKIIAAVRRGHQALDSIH